MRRRRRFPVLTVSVGLALVFVTALRPLFAQPAPALPPADDPALYPKVKVEPSAAGPAVEGRLKLAAVSLKTDTGSARIEMSHVRRITFQKEPDGASSDTVQLADKSIVRGKVLDEVFVVEITGGEAKLKKSEVREIKLEREIKLSLVAILLGLLTLTAMEIVLGVDNIIFLAIIANKLPKERRPQARKIGLAAALGTRIMLLGSLWLLLGLTAPLFTLPDFGVLHDMEAREVSLRDLILLLGGLFLIGKSTFEMHSKIEEAKAERIHRETAEALQRAGAADPNPAAKPVSFAWTIFTIAVIDIVFSLDSVITAVGMVEQVWVMIAAMVLSMLVMLFLAGPIADFVDRHPTIKVLALSFLILIGVMLVAEGLGQHIDKGYIYVAMGFALVIELINMRFRREKGESDVEGPQVGSRKVEDTRK